MPAQPRLNHLIVDEPEEMHPDAVARHIGGGGDPDQTDAHGRTALHFACAE